MIHFVSCFLVNDNSFRHFIGFINKFDVNDLILRLSVSFQCMFTSSKFFAMILIDFAMKYLVVESITSIPFYTFFSLNNFFSCFFASNLFFFLKSKYILFKTEPKHKAMTLNK